MCTQTSVARCVRACTVRVRILCFVLHLKARSARLSRKAPAKPPFGTRSLARRHEHLVALVERADEDPQLRAVRGVLLGQRDGAPLVRRNGNHDVVRKGAIVFRATSVRGEMPECDARRLASMAIHLC